MKKYFENATEEVLEKHNLTSSFDLTCGLPVQRMNIDDQGVTVSSFIEFSKPTTANRNKHIRLINQHAIEKHKNIEFVCERQDALRENNWNVWVMTDGSAVKYDHPLDSDNGEQIHLPTDVYVYERIPFNTTVETISEIETEVEKALNKLSNSSVTISLD